MAIIMGGDKSSRIGGKVQVPAGILEFEFVKLIFFTGFPEIDLATGRTAGCP
jgi:hypothetical protein